MLTCHVVPSHISCSVTPIYLWPTSCRGCRQNHAYLAIGDYLGSKVWLLREGNEQRSTQLSLSPGPSFCPRALGRLFLCISCFLSPCPCLSAPSSPAPLSPSCTGPSVEAWANFFPPQSLGFPIWTLDVEVGSLASGLCKDLQSLLISMWPVPGLAPGPSPLGLPVLLWAE